MSLQGYRKEEVTLCQRQDERGLPEIEGRVHRRILEHLNKAQRPEDLEILHRADIAHETSAEIIRVRDSITPLGFRHLSEVVEMMRIEPKIIRELVALFGPATYGEWATTHETTFPDGTAYHVAHAAVLKTGWFSSCRKPTVRPPCSGTPEMK